MKKLCLVLSLIASTAMAQTSPGFVNGQIPTAAQWNGYFANKQDYSAGGVPINEGGTGSTTATGAIINLGVINGTPTTGHCVQFFSATQIVDSGATCGTGSGVAGVSTFDGRSGTVSLTLADVTGVIPAAVTVASLPTCASGQEGQRRSVSDALSPSFAAPVYGGGTVHIGVGCNGSAWITGY